MSRLLLLLTSSLRGGAFSPLDLGPILALQNTRIEGSDPNIPIMRVRRVNNGDEVDIYDFDTDDPRKYKTSPDGAFETNEANLYPTEQFFLVIWYDQSQGLGSEEALNGTFDTDTDWILNTGWSISGGKNNATNTSTKTLQQNVLTNGKYYVMSVDVDVISGSVVPQTYKGVYSNIIDPITSSGTYQFVFKADITLNSIYFGGSSFTGSIDNVSIKEIQGNHAVQTVQASQPELKWEGETFGAELVVNGGFETDISNTTLNSGDETSSISHNTTSPITGSGDLSLKTTVVGTLPWKPRVIFNLSANYIIGKNYKMEFDSKQISGTSDLYGILNGSTLADTSVGKIFSGTENQTYYNLATDSLSNCQISVSGTNVNEVHFDNVSVKEVLTWSKPQIVYDGVDDYLEIPNTTELETAITSGNSTSVARVSTSEYGSIQGIFGKSNSGTNAAISYEMLFHNTNKIRGLTGDGVIATYFDGLSHSLDQLYNVFLLSTSPNDFFNIDKTNYSGRSQIIPQSLSANIQIGRAFKNSAFSLNGKINSTYLYDKVLTEQNIFDINDYLDIGKHVFSPIDINNLYAWYDSSDASSITKDGSNLVSQWNDVSGNGKHVTATTTARPTDTANGIDFDGTANFMASATASDWTFLHSGTGSTVFVVMETGSANPGVSMSMLGTSNTATAGVIYYAEDSAVNDGTRMFNYNGSALVLNYSNSDVAPQQTTNILSYLYGTEAGASNDLNMYALNSNYRNSDNLNTPSTNAPTHPLAIGANGSGNGGFFNGLIKEVLIYKRKLTTTEREKVANYLNDKWS